MPRSLLLLAILFLAPNQVHSQKTASERKQRTVAGGVAETKAEHAAETITKLAVQDSKDAKALQQPENTPAQINEIQERQAQAKSTIDTLDSQFPASPEVKNSASNFYQARGDLKRSSELAEQGLSHASPDGDKKLTSNLRTNRGIFEYSQGNFEQSYKDGKIAYELDPTNKRAFELYQYSDSALRAKEAVPTITENTKRLIALGDPAISQTASQWVDNQKKIPTAAGWIVIKVIESRKKGDLNAALGYAQDAVKADPSDPMAYFQRGRLNMDMKKYDDAMIDFSLAMSKGWNENLLFTLRADALLSATKSANPADKAGLITRYKAALSNASMAVAKDPKDARAYLLRGFAKDLLNYPASDVLADFQQAANLKPEYATYPQNYKPHDDQRSPTPEQYKPQERSKTDSPSPPYWILGLVGLVLLAGAWSLISRSQSPASAVIAPVVDVSPLTPGLLGGNFSLGDKLGAGGMGEVFKGMDENLKRPVAIKRMNDNLKNDPKGRARFMEEARTVASLKHTNIVVLHQVVTEAEELYLIFEEVEGKTLHALIQESPQKRLDFSATARILKMACAAVDYAHSRNVLHRDLKPSNIMIENETVKVMDFGLARSFRTGDDVQTAPQTGTPPYMAPEQGMGAISKESDIYSLAVCAYEMLTGELPFQGDDALGSKMEGRFLTLEHRGVKAPGALEDVFKKALDPDRRNRFHSAAEFWDAFTRSLPSSSLTA